MNKKGAIFAIGIVVVFISGMIFALNVLTEKKAEFSVQIGQRQFDVVRALSQSNEILSYLDKSAEYATVQSVVELAQKGGHAVETDCGSIAEYSLWQSDGAQCFPNENITTQLTREFLTEFDRHLKNIPEHNLRGSHYDVVIEDNETLTLRALSMIPLTIPKQEQAIVAQNKPFEYYKVIAYADVECDERVNEVFRVPMSEQWYNQGEKFIHANVKYNSDQSAVLHQSFFGVDKFVRQSQIGNERNKLCIPLGINELYNLKLQTFDDQGNKLCEVSTVEQNTVWMGKGRFGGYDLQTWGGEDSLGNPIRDSNEDGAVDRDCTDSPTYLQCPGIRAYYCGKTGWRTDPSEQGWEQIFFGQDSLDDTFVKAPHREPSDKRPLPYYIQAKTALKMQVDFSERFEQSEVAARRDTFTKKILNDKLGKLPRSNVQKQTIENIKYSFRPNVKAEIDYSLDDYEQLTSVFLGEQGLLNQVELCEQETFFEQCLKQEVAKKNSEEFEWGMEQDCPNFVSVKPPRLILFCVKNKKASLPFYDRVTDGLSFVNPTYQFAVWFVNLPPAPVENFEVREKNGSDKLAVVSWKKHEEGDVVRYNIYYSKEFSLEDKEIDGETIKQGEVEAQVLPLSQVQVNTATELKSIDLDCVFTTPQSCVHEIEDDQGAKQEELVPYKLYLVEDTYYLVMGGLEDEQYSFSITAIDREDNELAKIPFEKTFLPKDDIGPGMMEYEVQLQEATLRFSVRSDAEKYYVFILNQEPLISLENLVLQTSDKEFEFVPPNGMQSYTVGIIGVDEAENPLQMLEVSATEMILKINDEYEQIIDDLANSQTLRP